MDEFSPEELIECQMSIRPLAARYRLCLQKPRGRAGAQMGKGVGASVEILDHRPFVLGDDPRHLDWNAYARTGQWVAKTFRPEVRPSVDLAFDASNSMLDVADKRRRALQLFYLVFEGAERMGASVKVHCVYPDRAEPMERDAIQAGQWLQGPRGLSGAQIGGLARVRWRQDALRVWVSDLLYPEIPSKVVGPLVRGAGQAVILVPFAPDEVAPSWAGNLTLVDVESGEERVQYVDDRVLDKYRSAYLGHFAAYSEAAVGQGVALARVSAAGDFEASLGAEAVALGVFAPWT